MWSPRVSECDSGVQRPARLTHLPTYARTDPRVLVGASRGREEVRKRTEHSLSIVSLAEWRFRRGVTKAAVVPRQLRSHRGQGEGWQHAAGSLPAARAASQRGLQGRGAFQQTPGEPPRCVLSPTSCWDVGKASPVPAAVNSSCAPALARRMLGNRKDRETRGVRHEPDSDRHGPPAESLIAPS